MTQQILYSNIYSISSLIQFILIEAETCQSHFSYFSLSQQHSEGSAADLYLVVFVLVHVECLKVEEAVLQCLKHKHKDSVGYKDVSV